MTEAAPLIVVLLIAYSVKLSGASSCIPANYARFRDLFSEGRTSSPAGTPHPGRFFTTAYSFTCHGVITEWAAYTVNNGSHPIEFHVWRANETLQGVYHLVGINVFQDALPDSNRLISFKVPPEEQITVSPGDFVGVRTVEQAGSSDEGFALQFDRGDPGSHRRYSLSLISENFSTPTVLNLSVLSSVELLDPFGTVPVIRATVFDFASNITYTTTSMSEPQTTAPPDIVQVLPQSAIIAIAIGGSSVLVLAIVIAMVILCCVLCRRSRKRKNAATKQNGRGGQQSAIRAHHLVNNPAYNVGNNNFNNRLVANPAYNNQLTSNPAYNYNGDTDPYYSVIQN